jgi:hypothetical protein
MIINSCTAEYLSSKPTIDVNGEMKASPSATQEQRISIEATSTQRANQNQVPSLGKTPGVLECSDIVNAHQNATPDQWEAQKILLRGMEIYYRGTVYSVTETDAVHMSGSLCHATLHHVPHQIAVNLSHGQVIEGYGTILNINYYLGEDIDIEVNPDLIFVR